MFENAVSVLKALALSLDEFVLLFIIFYYKVFVFNRGSNNYNV